MSAPLDGRSHHPGDTARTGVSRGAASSGTTPVRGPGAFRSPYRRSGGRRRPLAADRRPLHVVLVANAAASRLGPPSEALEGARRLLLAHGARPEPHLTASLEELASVCAGADGRRIVVLGGDGSVHAAANLVPLPKELALLPAGRANNVARSLGIPLDPEAAVELAVRGAALGVDLIEATTRDRRRLAVEGVSVGFHALARAGYHSPNSADIAAGFRAALRAARDFQAIELRLYFDGVRRQLTAGQLFVANLPLYAFGLRVAPTARPDDGRFQLVALEQTRRRAIVPMLVRLRRGSHVARQDTSVLSASHAIVETCGTSPIVVDTENMGTGPIELRTIAGALRLVRPG